MTLSNEKEWEKANAKRALLSLNTNNVSRITSTDILRKDLPNLHSNKKQYVCQKCGKRFRQKGHFKVHLTLNHLMVFKCDICDNAYVTKNALNRHKKTHVKKKPCKCDHRFTSRCKKCVKTREKDSFAYHKLRHEGNNVQCSLCDFRCQLQSDLAAHQAEYHIERDPFKCSMCYFVSDSSAAMKFHKTQHQEREKYFRCALCPAFYIGGYILNRHFKEVHKEAYQCKLCSNVFKSEESIEEHTCTTTHTKNDLLNPLEIKKEFDSSDESTKLGSDHNRRSTRSTTRVDQHNCDVSPSDTQCHDTNARKKPPILRKRKISGRAKINNSGSECGESHSRTNFQSMLKPCYVNVQPLSKALIAYHMERKLLATNLKNVFFFNV